ncbi:MAG: 2TM domain-containing protein [Flavobacteriaceae bacterium]
MEAKIDYNQRREKAKKKVEELKKFYAHVRVYIVINVLILLLRGHLLDFLMGKTDTYDPGFAHWIDLNALITPIFWGIGLLFHGIYVYRHKFGFLKQWEERQIRKFIEEEDERTNRYQ